MEENMQSGCFQGHQRKWKSLVGVLCVIGIFLVIKSICVAQEAAKQPVPRNRVYKLRHISAEDAKQRLIDLRIGRNINELPHNSLIVESDNPGDLVKASSLLQIIDSEQPFVIKTILTAPDIQKLPRNDQIAAKIGGIVIGPTDTTGPVAIVDIHDWDLIAIAPEPLFDKIADAVRQLQAPAALQAKAPVELAEPNAPPVPQPDLVTEAVEAEVQPQAQKAGDEIEITDAPADKPSKTGAEAEEDLSAVELLEMMAEIEGQTDTEPKQAEEDFFGDELLEALAVAEKAAQEKLDAQIREVEKVESVEEPPKVVSLEKADDSRPERPEAETIGITKEDLAAIVQAEVAKLLKAQPAAEPVEPPAPAPPTVPSVQPIESQEQPAEEEKAQEEKHAEPAEPEGPAAPLDYLDRLAIPDAEKELELTLTLPEKVGITALLEMVGKLLGLNYIYDEKLIKGDVMLKVHGGMVKVKDAYALLESVLKFRGFVMTRRGRLVTIVPQAQALDYDPTLRTSPQDIQPGDVIVTSIFYLKHVDTASAEALLKSMKLGTIINAIPETGTLIVTGYAYRMGRIEELLKMIDVAGRPRKFQSRQLQYTVVADVLPKIQTLADQLGTVSVSISVSKTAPTAAPAKRQTAAQKRAAAKRKPTPAKPTTTRKGGAVAKQAVYLDTDERTNRILMIGLAEDVDLVNELIDALDVEVPDLRVIKEYEIQHVDPTQIIDTLGELGVVTGTSRRSTTQRRATPTSKTPAARRPATGASRGSAPGEEEEPQISILPATNSLLINALPAQHAMIALVIAHVDRELEEATLPYVIYPLENQNPQELADVLSKLIEKTVKAKAAVAAKDAKVQTRPTATTSTSKLQDEITIVADPKSFSIIVYASKKNQQWIGSLIKKLDEYRPQVLLDVTLVSISKYDEFGYDLDLVTKFPKLAAGGSMEKLSALIDPFPSSRVTEATSFSGTSGQGFYADEHIQALLTLIQKKEYGRVLARPKLLVNDNEKGTIQTKNETSIVSPKTDVVPVQGGGGTSSTSITIQSYTSDITLEIEPHISKGNQLRLSITLNRTDFEGLGDEYNITVPGAVGTLSGPEPPDLITTNVTTVVTVPDGKTIILGGLEQIDQSKDGTKIPLLGDIPIIGGLFRNISKISDQTRLYVFVKAHILRPGEQVIGGSDIIKASLENRATFEKYEKEMQEYEDWPGTKPEPMDPLKILEVDELVVP
jgi:type II secretory pathway component GspD/PulD (secretin)